MAKFYVGLDLGQAQDYTALSVIERQGSEEPTAYHVRHLERLRLGTPYPTVVDRVVTLMQHQPLRGHAELVVDATGVGAPVVDLLEQAGLDPVAVSITGGNTVSQKGRSYNVPKRDLVSVLQVLFQAGRLKVAEALPEAATLVRELLIFRVKINVDTAHDSYGAWREGAHDDLVLSVAMAVWYAECGMGSWELI